MPKRNFNNCSGILFFDAYYPIRYQYFAKSNTQLAETCVKLFNDVLSNVWMYLTKPMIDIATEFVKVI
jgi:hypothetical protein